MTDSQIDQICRAIARAADSITASAAPGRDATGGHVSSLTEAVMGVAAGLCRIADAIETIARYQEPPRC